MLRKSVEHLLLYTLLLFWFTSETSKIFIYSNISTHNSVITNTTLKAIWLMVHFTIIDLNCSFPYSRLFQPITLFTWPYLNSTKLAKSYDIWWRSNSSFCGDWLLCRKIISLRAIVGSWSSKIIG
jgi:hypothetical protein